MKLEIKVPSVGESVSSGDIEKWEKSSGEFVKKGEILVILETDKASMEIPAETEGILNIVKSKGQVTVGEVIGFIEPQSSAKAEESSTKSKTSSRKEESKNIASPQIQNDFKALKTQKARENLSPSVRRLVETHSLSPSEIKGSGKGGRLTKEDILTALKQAPPSQPYEPQKKEESDQINAGKLEVSTLANKDQNLKKGQRREPMTRLRRTTAERLVHSQHSTATLSTFNEVDLSRVIKIRNSCKEQFLKKYGVKLGFMSFFIKAVVAALKEYPRINAFIDGTDIVYNEHNHIGIAVSTEKGLVVPVLFSAETLSFAEIEKQIVTYRDLALSRKLTPDHLLGGTFTISNGGVFGSLLSTPILNPPQSGILGMHKIEQRPVAIAGKVEIRPMMYVTLSYDHRIVDGSESVGFLVKVKEGLEEPSRLLIDL